VSPTDGAGHPGIDPLLELAMCFMRREYDERIDVDRFQGDDAMMELGVALNLLGDELDATTVDKRFVDGILRVMNDALLVVAPDLTVVMANEAAGRAFGYPPGELQRLSISELLDEGQMPDDWSSRLLGDGAAEGLDLLCRRSDGQRFSLSFNGALLLDEAGAPLVFVLVGRDMIPIRRRDDQLRELGYAAAQSEDGLVVGALESDAQWRAVYVNDKFAAIHGYMPGEMIGLALGDLMAPSMEETLGALQEELRTTGVWQGEVERLRKDSSTFPARVSLTVFKNASGATMAVGSCLDITARKETEAKLLEATRRAEAANRAKDEFLANMSHEIRTPMNGVLGMAGLLAETDLDTQQRSLLRDMQSSARGLLAVINDILDISKIEAGQLPLNEAPFEPRRVVESVRGLLEADAGRHYTILKFLTSEQVPRSLVGDAARIRQILVNLVSNAIRFTEAGAVDVSVDCPQRDADRVVLEVAVTDNGEGIPEEMLGEIFEKFTQVDGSLTRQHGGAGLGLPISKELVELMGGEIGVTSEPGQGARFWFSLPLAIHSSAPVEQPSAAPHSPRALAAPGTVLVVEDNPINQTIASMILQKHGWEVITAEHGQQALDLLEGTTVDAILMDVQMPVMDGLTATAQIREREGHRRHTPIIAMTAHAMVGDRERCLDAGMDDYVSKPVTPETLLGAIHRQLPR